MAKVVASWGGNVDDGTCVKPSLANILVNGSTVVRAFMTHCMAAMSS